MFSSIDGRLGCYWILTVINNVAMNIGAHISFWISDFVFFWQMPSNGIAGSYGSSIFDLRNLHTVFYSAAPIYIPTKSTWRFSSLPLQHLSFPASKTSLKLFHHFPNVEKDLRIISFSPRIIMILSHVSVSFLSGHLLYGFLRTLIPSLWALLSKWETTLYFIHTAKLWLIFFTKTKKNGKSGSLNLLPCTRESVFHCWLLLSPCSITLRRGKTFCRVHWSSLPLIP